MVDGGRLRLFHPLKVSDWFLTLPVVISYRIYVVLDRL